MRPSGTGPASSPAALDPDRLFPDPFGPAVDRSDEGHALDAIAEAFGVSLPRFALDHGRLHTLPTRPWTRPAEPGTPDPAFTRTRLTFTRTRR